MRVIVMLISCTLLSVAAETTIPPPGVAPPPPVVDIPEIPEVHLPRLAALPPEVRDRVKNLADATARKVLVANGRRSGLPDAAIRIPPPPLPPPVGGGTPPPPPAVGSTGPTVPPAQPSQPAP